MPPTLKVVLFEDTADRRATIIRCLRKHLSPDDSAIPFEPGQFIEPEEGKDRMYEDRLENILTAPPFDNTTLVVADRDLSKSQDSGFGGLSVNSVAAACKRLAIPVCAYARQPEPSEHFLWSERWEEGLIVLHLSEGEDELARKVVIAASGFAEIQATLERIEFRAKSSPAKLLTAVLGKPEYSDKVALYAVGDQNRLPEILSKVKQTQGRAKRTSHFLGYWLWDSLLRYPGVFVNEVAAASYLNIETESFRRAEVQAVFEAALYNGPFADPHLRQWWRGMLDDIVSSENCADGIELVRKRVDPNIERSRCSVDESIPAGYYCIITRQPVSLENSRGGLSWFPRGADLTRVSNRVFEEYEPWLGA